MPDDAVVAGSADLDDAVFEVLREAVRMAREEQIHTLAELGMRLKAQGDGRDAFQGAPVVRRAGGIAGAVDDDRFGTRGDDRFQCVLCDRVSIPFLRLQQDRCGIVQQGLILIRDPEGDGDNQFVARFQQGFRHVIERMFGAAGHQNLGLVVVQPLFIFQLVRDGIAQFVDA